MILTSWYTPTIISYPGNFNIYGALEMDWNRPERRSGLSNASTSRNAAPVCQMH